MPNECIYIPRHLYDKLRKEAESRDIGISRMIREILEEYYGIRRGEGNRIPKPPEPTMIKNTF